jgi:hypothetical protein
MLTLNDSFTKLLTVLWRFVEMVSGRAIAFLVIVVLCVRALFYVFRSNDGAKDWTKMSPILTFQGPPPQYTSSPSNFGLQPKEKGGVEAAIASALALVTHVTHTHSSSRDVWDLAFDNLAMYARNNASFGLTVRYVVCVDTVDPVFAQRWPWLEVVSYGDAKLYPRKVSACLRNITDGTKLVLHTMEDMVRVKAVAPPSPP